jgi:hypothetical protein
MIVDTMTAQEIEREYIKDLVKLYPIVERRKQYLTKAFQRSGKQYFEKPSLYKVNQNQYVVNYIVTKEYGVVSFDWHYISNTRQPYFMAPMQDHQTEELYYSKVDAHAILRYIKRTPDYVPVDKELFIKEAIGITMDLMYPVKVDANYISPNGLWPLTTEQPVNGFLHVKTFIHKSTLTKRQREIYMEGLKGVEQEAMPLYIVSLVEFGLVKG